jgi:hypothetical protein
VFLSAAAAALLNLALPDVFANFTVFLGTGDDGVLEVGLIIVMMGVLSFFFCNVVVNGFMSEATVFAVSGKTDWSRALVFIGPAAVLRGDGCRWTSNRK